jgi:hypothetical protein
VEDMSARKMARDWWHEQIAARGEVDVKVLAADAVEHFAKDDDFCESFLADFLPSTMYDMGQRIVAQTRLGLKSRVGLRKQIERDMTEDVQSRWDTWLQYEPNRGVYMSLTKMTRKQLIASADFLAEQKNELAFEESWLRLIAKKVTGAKTVGDVFTDDQLQALRDSLKPPTI